MTDDELLRDLTERRPGLSKAEWATLYSVVFRNLQGCHWDVIQKLSGMREDYIQDYFEDKLFRLDGPRHVIYHTGALRRFFRQYLIDRLPPDEKRKWKRKSPDNPKDAHHTGNEGVTGSDTVDGDVDHDWTPESAPEVSDGRWADQAGESPDETSATAIPTADRPDSQELHLDMPHRGPLNEDDEDGLVDPVDRQIARDYWERLQRRGWEDADIGKLLNLLADDAVCTGLTDAERGRFHRFLATEFGLQIPMIQAAARRFLAGDGEWTALKPESHWMRIYLREHFCPDDGLALTALKVKYRLGSTYHYDAVKLGVSVPKKGGGAAAMAAFRKSYRGQWLASLNIPVDDDHRVEMAVALKILCLVALDE
jgi:hypothetical protein